jgi:hypothetical protein
MTRTRLAASASALALAIAALAYLRDPLWLAAMESGFRAWHTSSDGTRYRSMAGHASFFVPADARAIVIPARMPFADRLDPPVEIAIAIDDRPADAFVLRDDAWRRTEVRLPPPGTRKLRRIDIRVDRLRPGLRGADIGEVTIVR